MKKLRNFFNEAKNKWKNSFNKTNFVNDKIYEVRLWGIDGKSFNEDEQRAWEIIKEIHQEVLFDDNNWHFFYENWYNIIRCSAKFYSKLIEKLDSLGVYYKEHGEWIDEQESTRKHQKIFQGVFHYFTLMALEEYDSKDIDGIYDRVSHCFFNHQFYVLEDIRKENGVQWEANLMSKAVIERAGYSSYCYSKGINPSKSNTFNTYETTLIEHVEKIYE